MPKKPKCGERPEDSHEFRPCPFCGNTKIYMQAMVPAGHKVFCHRCGAEMRTTGLGSGDNHDQDTTAGLAAANWNTRLGPQDRDELDKYRKQIRDDFNRERSELHRLREQEEAQRSQELYEGLFGLYIDEDEVKEAAAEVVRKAAERASADTLPKVRRAQMEARTKRLQRQRDRATEDDPDNV